MSIDERQVEEEAQKALAEGLAVDLFTARQIARMNAERRAKEAEDGAQQPRADDARRSQE